MTEWPTAPGQCLVCGGRGGYPGAGPTDVMRCGRCAGTGRDPARGEDWYIDTVIPVQLRVKKEAGE